MYIQCTLPKKACFLSAWGCLMPASQSSTITFSGNDIEVSGVKASSTQEPKMASSDSPEAMARRRRCLCLLSKGFYEDRFGRVGVD